MARVGLTEQEIHELLNIEFTGNQKISDERLKTVIGKIVIANNEKLEKDLKKMINSVFLTL